MGKTNLGRVAFAPHGTYSNETAYKRLDVVESEDSSYLFLKDSTGITPTGDGEVTMLLAKKGKDFTYEDFTAEQLATLKGADGKDGLKGDKGEPGKGLTILGYYGTLDLLKAGVTTPEPGDAYGIGTAASYDIYVFDGVTNDWVNNGKLAGGGEGGGNVVLIPAEIMGLSNTSTPEEILTVFGGKDVFIDVVTRVKEGAIVAINIKEGDGDVYIPVPMIGAVVDAGNNSYILSFIAIDFSPASKNYTALISLVGDVATIEKSNYPYGYANIVSIPSDVMSLSNESTSDEIKTAFGGKPAFDAIVEKIRAGKAVAIIPDAEGSVFSASGIGVDSYTDSNNLNLSIISTSYGALFQITITVANSVFNCYAGSGLLLTDTNLISDPSVGGTYKPASAEAVKVVNDKINFKVVNVPKDVKGILKNNNHDSIISKFGGMDNLITVARQISEGYVIVNFAYDKYNTWNFLSFKNKCNFTDERNFKLELGWVDISSFGPSLYYLYIDCVNGVCSVFDKLEYDLTVSTSSDQRLKTITQKPDFVKALNGLGEVVAFHYNEVEAKRKGSEDIENIHYGLLYQNVLESSIPHITASATDGYGNVSYNNPDLIGLMIGAIQQQSQEIKELRAEIEALKSE